MVISPYEMNLIDEMAERLHRETMKYMPTNELANVYKEIQLLFFDIIAKVQISFEQEANIESIKMEKEMEK